MSYLNSTSFFDYLLTVPSAANQKVTKVTKTLSEKIAANLAAIQIVKNQIETGGGCSEEDRAVLAQYSGWGQMSALFDRGHPQNAKLAALVSPKEYAGLEASILTSYYTPIWIIEAMYRASARLGVQEGLLLDPACGSGRFLANMPASMHRMRQFGIELDPLSGHVARLLNPAAKIYVNQPFEAVKLPNHGDFSLVIGNPPYCSVNALDRSFGPLSLHNYFSVRGLAELHIGGLLAFVVSSWLMDSKDPAARSELAARGELVAACRLPNSAFASEAANVATDILIFQRTEYPDLTPAWLETVALTDTSGQQFTVNKLFADQPELVAGQLVAPSTFTQSCNCVMTSQTEDALSELVTSILDNQTSRPLFYRPVNANAASKGTVVDPAGLESVGVYEFGLAQNGDIVRRLADSCDVNGQPIREYQLVTLRGKKDRIRLIAMLRVKSVLMQLIQSEQENQPSNIIRNNRANLNATYDAFTAEFGPFHSSKNKSVLSEDPWYYRLRALELDYTAPISQAVAEKEGIESREEFWVKSPLFTKRVIEPLVLPSHANNLADAVLISMSFKGEIDLDYIKRIVGFSGSLDQLSTTLAQDKLAFVDPISGKHQHAAKYLSGYVRAKLDDARLAAQTNPLFSVNVRCLEEVQPKPILAVDIFAPLNARWLPTSIHAAFIRHLVDNPSLSISVDLVDDSLCISGTSYISSVKTQSEWGTHRKDMLSLLDALFNNKKIVVQDKCNVTGGYIPNESETLAAQHKAEEIKACWELWVLDSVERRELIEQTYNAVFNGFVTPAYDGSYLPLNGCAVDLYHSQRNVIARALFEPTLLIDHCVGAGKTYSLVGIAHELRRINPQERTVLVCPNHLVSQHATAAQFMFPGMNVMVLDQHQMTPATRRTALAKFAQSDFDLCIIPLSVFGLIPAPQQIQIEIVEEELMALRSCVEQMQHKHYSAREIQKRIKEKESQLVALNNMAHDDLLNFADLRISALLVDESQFGKNLFYSSGMSNIAGMGSQSGSQRAFDLFIKSRYVLRNGGRYVEATGTPILNSIVEAHRHLRFMLEDYTRKAGLTHFDAFSSVFAQPVNDYELAPSGRGYKMRSRIKLFTNLCELQAMYSTFADVVTEDQLPNVLPRLADGRSAIPPLTGGKIIELVIEPNEYQERGFAEIVHAYGNIDRKTNNALQLIHKGRMLSLDARLVYQDAPDNSDSKINKVVDYLVKKYHATTSVKGTQLVFMDRSIPARHKASTKQEWLERLAKARAGDEAALAALTGLDVEAVDAMLASSFSLYDELVAKLIDAGIPASEIAVIHDYKTDLKKEALRSKVNKGEIRILIGSTELMGSGMNVNQRLVSLIDFDLPLRPGDLIQRHGRIERQGNLLWLQDPAFTIDIVIPITRRTLDAWQLGLLHTKQRFISMFRNLKNSVRHYEEEQEALDFGELSAIVADDPRILAHVRGKATLRKLEAAYNNWFHNRICMQDSLVALDRRIQHTEEEFELMVADAALVAATDSTFAMTINNVTYYEKGLSLNNAALGQPKTAADALSVVLRRSYYSSGRIIIASYRGTSLVLEKKVNSPFDSWDSDFAVQATHGKYALNDHIKTISANGILNAYIAFVDDMQNKPASIKGRLFQYQKTKAEMTLESAKPFAKKAEMDELTNQLRMLELELVESVKATPAEQDKAAA